MQLLQYNLYQYNFLYNQKFKKKNEIKLNKLCITTYNKSCLFYPEDIIYLYNIFFFLFDQRSIIISTKKNISEFSMKAKNVVGTKITKRKKKNAFSCLDSALIMNKGTKSLFKEKNYKSTCLISLGLDDISHLEGVEKIFNKLVYMVGININIEFYNLFDSYNKLSMIKSIIKIL
uniref:Ribosomal protein L5 n=1 Tax=Cyanoptyche gloeocystis TaxID=77922 RepID=A0A096Y6X7_9EUKA|nr:ribosomal protein L5 [Cyanoptyche gloeocystis]AIM52074.1 ribosomal protein L5 [Cyanoptyche gloeocystis]